MCSATNCQVSPAKWSNWNVIHSFFFTATHFSTVKLKVIWVLWKRESLNFLNVIAVELALRRLRRRRFQQIRSTEQPARVIYEQVGEHSTDTDIIPRLILWNTGSARFCQLIGMQRHEIKCLARGNKLLPGTELTVSRSWAKYFYH